MIVYEHDEGATIISTRPNTIIWEKMMNFENPRVMCFQRCISL